MLDSQVENHCESGLSNLTLKYLTSGWFNRNCKFHMRIVSMVNICTISNLLISMFNNRVSYSASKRFCTLPVMRGKYSICPSFHCWRQWTSYLLLLTTFRCLSVVGRFRNMRGNSGQPQKDISKEMNFL
jgi:hypothetical protein